MLFRTVSVNRGRRAGRARHKTKPEACISACMLLCSCTWLGLGLGLGLGFGLGLGLGLGLGHLQQRAEAKAGGGREEDRTYRGNG